LYGLDKTYQLVPVVSSPEIVASQPTPSKRIRLHEKTPPRLVDKAPPLQDGRDHSPDKDTVLAKDSHTDFVKTSSLEFVRTYNDGKTETVPLTTGPDGFAIAILKNETVTTEVPSLVLLLAAPPKKRAAPRKNKDAAKKRMKKPQKKREVKPAAKKSMKKQRKKQKVVFVHMCTCALTYFLTLYVRLFTEFPSRA